ncbi:MAG: serralysin [Sulfitobacter sp.]|jgi:hypothetical protein
MAFLTGVSFPITGDDVIDAATQGSYWDLSASNVIHWSLTDGFLGEVWLNPNFSVEKISQALGIIEMFIDVDFQFAGYFVDPLVAGAIGADLVYSLYGDDRFGADPTWAVGFFPNWNFVPSSANGLVYPGWATQAGDIFLNANHHINSQTTFEPGSAGFSLILHETFHALGLKHNHDDGDSGRPTLAEIGADEFNQDWFSVMSYNDQFNIELNKWDPETPMLLDVLALQALYGANLATNAGNSTHLIPDTSTYTTIWDAGGVDIVDMSLLQEGWKVTLPDIQLSTLVSTKAGAALPIAQLADENEEVPAPTALHWLLGDIENVLGTAFDDEIVGNSQNNILEGSGGNDDLFGQQGNDQIDGGSGTDTAHFSGNQSSYTLALSSLSTVISDRRESGDGTDQLTALEFLSFETDLLGSPFDLTKFAGPASLSGAQLESFIELYIAYFNRAPDAVGLNFWGTQFANGLTLDEMAALFAPQDETLTTYPPGTSNEDFAFSVYKNVLGRDPDPDGFTFWVGQLDAGNFSRDQFILEVLRGVQSDSPDREYLDSKVDLGAYFAVHKGLSNVANASAAMALYDGSQSSITDTVNAVDAFYVNALDPVDGEFLMPLIGVLDDPLAIS